VKILEMLQNSEERGVNHSKPSNSDFSWFFTPRNDFSEKNLKIFHVADPSKEK
jgi:hypothetical protein